MNRKAKNGFRITISAISALMLVTAAFPQVAYGFTVGQTTSSGSSSGTKSGSGSSSGSTNNSGKNTNTEKLNNLKNNYEQLEKEKKAIEAKLKDIKNEKSQTIAERNSISRQIDISNEQLALLKDKIKLINDEISQKEAEISAKQTDIDNNYELFKSRVRALYMTDSSSVVNIIFGAQSFTDFLERSEYIKRVTDHDEALLKQLKADKTAIEAAKAEVDADKAELEQAQTDEAQKKKELNGQYAKVSEDVAQLKKMEAEFNANREAIEKDMKETQAELAKIYASMKSIGDYVGGEYTWPLPGYRTISSSYGWRFGGGDFHTGTDITGSGVYGATIVAANTGVVRFVQTNYSAGRGYGMYVIIDHGGGQTTLYGHMSNISVSLNETVSKGQAIGNVGSTGWSTGPHLHFEIRINGQHTNPMNYFH